MKLGKKGREWRNALRILKADFARKQITTCEFRFIGCWIDNTLGFSHKEKRNKLNSESLFDVVLACGNCHRIVENHPNKRELHEKAQARRFQLTELLSV